MRPAIALLVTATVVTACLGGGLATTAPGTAAGTSPRTGASPAATAPGSAVASTPAASSGAPTILPASGTWSRLETTGAAPDAREDHTWTVAEDGTTAYLYGGRDGGTAYDDLWAFDLGAESWTRVPVSGDGPPARFGHEAAWIPGRGLAIWAGQAGARFFDDLWLFDPDARTWRLLPAAGQVPVPRYGSCSGVGPDGRLWISHGFTEDGARFADTRAYDFATETWTNEAPAGAGPVERCLHACWWTSDGRLALYGGQTTGVAALGDLWFLTPGTLGAASHAWTEAPGAEPPARQLAAVARWAGLTVITGGGGLDRRPLDDTWLLLDGAAGFVRLDTGGTAPPARSGAALVHDVADGRFVLFGGLGDEALDDAWSLTFP